LAYLVKITTSSPPVDMGFSVTISQEFLGPEMSRFIAVITTISFMHLSYGYHSFSGKVDFADTLE
jgi:hypothetical protein